jgi:thiol-disulfide isomerase/thioredoxin
MVFALPVFATSSSGPAPAFQLTGRNGKAIDLSQFKGQVVMINFWATWCGPCQTEYPELLTTYLWYRSRDFEFVSVALNTPDERPSVQKFLDEHHSAVRNLIIDTDDVYAVQAAFDSKWESGVPFTLVLAPDGSEIYRIEGEADILALRRRILGNLPDAGMFAGNTEYWRR